MNNYNKQNIKYDLLTEAYEIGISYRRKEEIQLKDDWFHSFKELLEDNLIEKNSDAYIYSITNLGCRYLDLINFNEQY